MDSRECPEVTEKFVVPRDLASLLYRVTTRCCIENKVMGWESRMQETLTETEVECGGRFKNSGAEQQTMMTKCLYGLLNGELLDTAGFCRIEHFAE